MIALITGINGFVGKYLSEYLLAEGIEVFGTVIEDDVYLKNVTVLKADVLNKQDLMNVIKTAKPDCIYHLAGQSMVGLSWQNPTLTFNVNVNGTLNLLDSVRTLKISPKILLIGSSDQYGKVNKEDCPINENHAQNPQSPYAVSKVAQEQVGKLYFNSYDCQIIMVRAFNHIGPGQNTNFVVPDFAGRIAQIEKGAPPIINVGNLDAYRDFSDVRDIVRGYRMLMDNGKIGQVYNIGSGRAIKISEILDTIISFSTKKIQVRIDPQKLRPSDVPVIVCDNQKIYRDVGWKPIYNISDTLKSVFDCCVAGA